MKVIRKTPLAINKPMLIVGIERSILAIVISFAVITAVKLNRPIALCVFVAGCYAAKWASRKDPDLLRIVRQAWKLRAIYCPLKREVKA